MCFVCRWDTSQPSTIMSDVNYSKHGLHEELFVSMNWCWTAGSQGGWLLCLREKYFGVSEGKLVADPLLRLCKEQGSGSQVKGRDRWLQSHPATGTRVSKPWSCLETLGIPSLGTAWFEPWSPGRCWAKFMWFSVTSLSSYQVPNGPVFLGCSFSVVFESSQ